MANEIERVLIVILTIIVILMVLIINTIIQTNNIQSEAIETNARSIGNNAESIRIIIDPTLEDYGWIEEAKGEA
jgi:competence protein ComGC